MTTLAQLIASARTLSGDGSSDNFQRAENCSNNDGKADGSNLIFYVQNQPIAPSGLVQLRVDNVLLSPPYANPPIVTINEAIGQIVFAAGNAPTTSVFANYYYYLFPDAVWTEFVAAAMSELNFLNTQTHTLDQDVQQVEDKFLGALKLVIRSWFCARVAQQTGLWYNQRLQERVEDRDNIAKKWLEQSKEWRKEGLLARDDAYRGSGSKEHPAMKIKQFQPKPWSPYR